MKKSFSLIEVLIAVSILSIVMTAILQMRENNIQFLQNLTTSNKNSEYICISTLYENNTTAFNTNVYLDKIVDFKDDDIRKELKEQKVFVKSELEKSIDLSNDELVVSVEIYKQTHKIQDKMNKVFYTFKLIY